MCAMKKAMLKSILVVDDDLDLLMLLERRLMNDGYLVETAASLPEAEEVLSTFIPRVVLLDINVRGEDGRQLCWKLKSGDQFRETKVIIISGYDYNTGRALLFGADDLLPKPFHMDFLLHRMAQMLEPVVENISITAESRKNQEHPGLHP